MPLQSHPLRFDQVTAPLLPHRGDALVVTQPSNDLLGLLENVSTHQMELHVDSLFKEDFIFFVIVRTLAFP